jgi:hypothetical protein
MRLARYLFGLAGLLALAALTGCGSQGNPLPPSLELPRPVSDLKAVRKGDKVLLTWTAPGETTDKLRIKEAGKTRVCRSAGAPAAKECAAVAELPAGQTPASGAASYTDTLPGELQEQRPAGFAVYTVEVTNANGRSAGLSNRASVLLAPTLPPPEQVAAEITAQGVVLRWTWVPAGPKTPNIHYVFHIYRQAKGAAPKRLGTVSLEEASFLDDEFEWEKTYSYWVNVTTVRKLRDTHEVRETPLPGGLTQTEIADGAEIVLIEGDDSSTVEIVARDSFPPAAPTAVEAVASSGGGQSFIDLTWTPNNEADLAGYNVYRREGDPQPQKINAELVKTPAFRDSGVVPGQTYFYSVSAVDLRSNESGRSEETSESVPQP